MDIEAGLPEEELRSTILLREIKEEISIRQRMQWRSELLMKRICKLENWQKTTQQHFNERLIPVVKATAKDMHDVWGFLTFLFFVLLFFK
jgi:hypothetical protein